MMDNKDWFDCGARIGDLVQSAIDSKNYQHLNEAITDAINDTVDALQKSLTGGGKASQPGRSKGAEPQRPFGGRPEDSFGEYRARGTAYDRAKEKVNTGDLFEALSRGMGGAQQGGRRKVRRSLKGIASIITGFSLTAFFGIGALLMGLIHFIVDGSGGFLFATILLTILAVISGLLGRRGLGARKQMDRAEQYMRIVGDREYCTVDELAAGTGRSAADVRKDLKEMIADGMFESAAYLDEGGTTFMVSHEAYRQYQDALKASRERERASQEKAQERRKAEKNMAEVSEETQSILQEGREFIAHIHECNERILDEVMSEKLDVLENVVTRIFRQVEAKPESAPDLHRMMSYYLPITRKLIDAYIELDDQNLQGENATRTRREIEMSLDTINSAFATFLDSFFENTAWDISSDITTLKTMMARDGLTGNRDFAGGRIRTVGDDLKAPEQQAAEGNAALSAGAQAAAGSATAGAGARAAGMAGAYSAAGAGGSQGAAAAAPAEEKQ